jgi:hypothetical protein
MNPELAAVRADLFDALVAIPDVTVYAHEPDAVDLPAVWIDQTAGTQGIAAPVLVAGWDVVIASETLTAADTTDLIDDLIGVVIDNVAGVRGARFEGWQRADRDVAGTTRPTATVSWMTDHVLC